jgi:MIP family channel proteins
MTLFVWVGCSTAVAAQAMQVLNPGTTNDNTMLTAVSLAFGIGITVLVYSIAPISGGHLNPAVTLAFVVLGQMDITTALMYMLSQCMGAFLGSALVWGTTASQALMDLDGDGRDKTPPFLIGSNSVQTGLPLGSAFLGETLGTFVLVWTVIMTAVHKKSIAANIAPIAIGWSVVLSHLVLVPLTGCGINPARSLGPHVVCILAGVEVLTRGWWIYYTAPFVGATVAALVGKYIFQILDEHQPAEENAQDIECAK